MQVQRTDGYVEVQLSTAEQRSLSHMIGYERSTRRSEFPVLLGDYCYGNGVPYPSGTRMYAGRGMTLMYGIANKMSETDIHNLCVKLKQMLSVIIKDGKDELYGEQRFS